MAKNIDLKKENKELKEKLKLVEGWLKREVEWEKKEIRKKKILNNSLETRKNDFSNAIEETIINSLKIFLGANLYNSLPDYIIEKLISWELLYYNLHHQKWIGGIWVVVSYQKAIDFLVEENITKQYRRYVNKNWPKELKTDDFLENSLNLVVKKWYSLSIWRLFDLIDKIKNNKNLYEYSNTFKLFLEDYEYIREIILDDNFYNLLKEIINTWVLGEKRHKWTISFEETKLVRKILIWDLKDKNCILYMLIKIWEIEMI